MARYLGGRFVSGLVTLFLFVSLMFLLVNVVLPGDWTSQFILTAEGNQTLSEALGLDRPLGERYAEWITGLVTFDLGTSFTGEPVWTMISRSLATTMFVLLVAVVGTFLLGAWMGRVSAYTNRVIGPAVLTFVSIICMTVFPPALAIALQRGANSVLGHLNASQIQRLDELLWEGNGLDPSTVTWQMVAVVSAALVLAAIFAWVSVRWRRRRMTRWVLPVLLVLFPLGAWAAMGLLDEAVDIGLALSMLVFGVMVLTFGEVVLTTRAAMEDAMGEDYVLAARARGLPEREVRDKHAARTALLPVLSRFVVAIPYLLTGLVILESVFGGVGMGSLIFNAVTDQDIPVVVGSLLVIGLITIVLRLGLDVAHALLDPRIRFGDGHGR